MVIDFSTIDCAEKPVLVLRNLDGTAIQTLGYAFDVSVSYSYNELSELEFSLPAYIDGKKTPHYDDVVGMKIVDVRSRDTGDGKIHGFGQFILVDPSEESDGVRRVKTCKAYSLEYEFQKKNITLEEGTYNFYSPYDTENTIIGRILEKMPEWKIGYIDPDLYGKYRTFDVTEDVVYNFIKSDVQESYGCIFEFDTYERTINIVSVENEPEAKPIYLSPERLIKEVEIEEDSDSIVTCVDVSGADGVTIRSVNPTGTNKIYNLDYFMTTANFPQALIDKWYRWVKLCYGDESSGGKQEDYYNLSIEQNLLLAQLTTEQSNLSELENQLDSYNHVLSTKVQAVSEGLLSNSDEEYRNARNDVTNTEKEIAAKKDEIAKIQQSIDGIVASIKNINDDCKMESFFTPDELSSLQRYFIEGCIQDDTFSATMVEEYGSADINQGIPNGKLAISKSMKLTHTVSGTQLKNIDTAEGGEISVSIVTANDSGTNTETVTLTGRLVKSTSEVNPNGTKSGGSFIYTAVLGKGKNLDGDFESGRLTLIGDCDNYQYTEADDPENPSGMLSYDIKDCTLYFTKNVTAYEKYSIEQELYEYGKQVLDAKSKPTYTFSIDSGNFLYDKDFTSFKNALQLGKRVYLRLGDDDNVITPYVTGVEWDFEDPSSFTLEFSDTYTSSDKSFKLAKLLEQSISMGKKLDLKGGAYNSFVNSGASTFVKRFMDSALDLAKNRVLSSGNQAIEFGDAGIRVRQWSDDTHTSYDDEQLWIVDNMIAFTKDNWATSNMAIGKIFDENIIGTDGTKGATAYGIAAPYLVGTVLAGRNLIIDTENGSFRVDSSGVTLDSMKLNIVSSAGNGTGLTFDADEGLTHVVKKTEGGRTHTYEAGFSATNDNDKGYGLYFAVDGSNKLYFDVSDAELVVDGDIWCRSLYLGKSRTDILTYIDSDGVEHSTTDRGKMNAIGGQYISCAGLSIEGSDGSFSIDNNGNVVIENGSIHMQSGNNTIDIDASTGLLFKRGGLMKLKLDITTGDVTLGDGAILTAPKITGGEITGGIFRATGQGRNNEAAYYIQNGNVRCGYISYDSNGAGTAQEAKERVFFTTVDNVALKIQSSGNMSLAAGNNNQKTVYIASDTEINGTLKIGGETAATREYLKDELDKLRSWVSNNFMAV